MDLSTVESKIKTNKYSSDDEVNYDINLIWDNAILFNEPGSSVYDTALLLKESHQKQWPVFLAEQSNPQPKTTKLSEEDRISTMD